MAKKKATKRTPKKAAKKRTPKAKGAGRSRDVMAVWAGMLGERVAQLKAREAWLKKTGRDKLPSGLTEEELEVTGPLAVAEKALLEQVWRDEQYGKSDVLPDGRHRRSVPVHPPEHDPVGVVQIIARYWLCVHEIQHTSIRELRERLHIVEDGGRVEAEATMRTNREYAATEQPYTQWRQNGTGLAYMGNKERKAGGADVVAAYARFVDGQRIEAEIKYLLRRGRPEAVRDKYVIEAYEESPWGEDLAATISALEQRLAGDTSGAAPEPLAQVKADCGVSLRNVAEILQNGDLERMERMLRRWNRCRVPMPGALGRDAADRRVKLYEPTAIVEWCKKVEHYLSVPEDTLTKRLANLARETAAK